MLQDVQFHYYQSNDNKPVTEYTVLLCFRLQQASVFIPFVSYSVPMGGNWYCTFQVGCHWAIDKSWNNISHSFYSQSEVMWPALNRISWLGFP